MRLEFTYTPADLEEAANAAGGKSAASATPRRAWRGLTLWLLFIGLAVVVFALLSQGTRRPTPTATTVPRPSLFGTLVVPLVPWVLIFGFIWFFVFRQLRGRFVRALEDDPQLQQQQTFEADEDGVRMSTPLSSSSWRWANFVEVAETPNLLLLRMSNQSFLIVPKRSAADAGQLRAIRDFLAAHVAPPTGGFPVTPLQVLPYPGPGREDG